MIPFIIMALQIAAIVMFQAFLVQIIQNKISYYNWFSLTLGWFSFLFYLYILAQYLILSNKRKRMELSHRERAFQQVLLRDLKIELIIPRNYRILVILESFIVPISIILNRNSYRWQLSLILFFQILIFIYLIFELPFKN